MMSPTVYGHPPRNIRTLLTRIAGQRNAVHLLTQDLQRENLRQALLAQRNALLQGQQILQDLQQKKYGDETMSQPSSASTAGDDGQGSFRMPTPLSEGMDEV
jgi:hypothetical protein